MYNMSTPEADGLQQQKTTPGTALGPLVPIEYCLNATAYLSIVADHVHPLITTMYPSSDG